jgi:hypothetical protein
MDAGAAAGGATSQLPRNLSECDVGPFLRKRPAERMFFVYTYCEDALDCRYGEFGTYSGAARTGCVSCVPCAPGGRRCCLSSVHGLCAELSGYGWDSHFAHRTSLDRSGLILIDSAVLSRLVVEERIDEHVGDCCRHEDRERHNRKHCPPRKVSPLAMDGFFAGVVALPILHSVQCKGALSPAYLATAQLQFPLAGSCYEGLALKYGGLRRVTDDFIRPGVASAAFCGCVPEEQAQATRAARDKENADGGKFEGREIFDERTRQSASVSGRFMAGGGCCLRLSCGPRLRRQPRDHSQGGLRHGRFQPLHELAPGDGRHAGSAGVGSLRDVDNPR